MDTYMEELRVLAFESTAHTFGAALVEGDSVLCMDKAQFRTDTGGMKPYEVANHHVKQCVSVTQSVAGEADFDAVAYSESPGIGQCLRVGNVFAKSIALQNDVPVIPVNHCVAHIEIGRATTDASDPVFIYVSGGNTQVISFESGKYRVFGETLDIGVGNLLDRVARELGLGFPGGPAIERLAAKTDAVVEAPYTMKGMDIALGGIFTHFKELIHQSNTSPEVIANTVQETVFAMVVEATERALSHTQKEEVLLGGGVGCNQRLQEMLQVMTSERQCEVYIPENKFLVDNAGMIGVAANKIGINRAVAVSEAGVHPKRRTDEVEIPYR